MYQVDYNSYRSVKGFNHRVRFLVLHYTAENFSDSVTSLTGSTVSVHYLIPDPADETYLAAGFSELRIINMVDENERAWHAGTSVWANRSNLNDTSLGIEIVNLATDQNGKFTFPPYNPCQIDAVKQLALNIIQRYPDMKPENIVAHSDIAPGRKSDPGASFPWYELYKAGIGAWYDDTTRIHYQTLFDGALPAKNTVLLKLNQYGYDISGANSDTGYTALVRAFQLHFRQRLYDGVLDSETAAILYALVEKYKS
ncbi:N-acetylmuramoyl-L-alanine amidase [Erwinia sp. AnSW2-5]|uniref:N-acetylmuramoyl-L-alanine amidase n=1 Tax=Erwinia sp. AnSW2-5 TaxID=3367692 RepID=UPI003859C87C